MRSIEFHPSSAPPVFDRDLELYAGKWVVVRGGKVVLAASTHDALAAKREFGKLKDGDRILRLPPATAS